MNKLSCVAIDDEPLVLHMIQKYAGQVPYLDLIETFESGFDAIELIQSQQIDLLLLDINMPDIDGIQLLKSLNRVPMVIFTTAHKKYALEGYELDIVDYLLKPYRFDRFLKAINKARSIKSAQQSNYPSPSIELENGKTEAPRPDTSAYLFVKSEYYLIKINNQDIAYIQGFSDYVKIYQKGERKAVLSLQTLKAIEEKLSPNQFIRVHRSYIINKNLIELIRNNKILIEEKEIPIGKYYRDNFYSRVVNGHL